MPEPERLVDASLKRKKKKKNLYAVLLARPAKVKDARRRGPTSVNDVVLVAPVDGSDQLVDVAARLVGGHAVR